MYKKSFVIIVLALTLAGFLFFMPYFFAKKTPARMIDRLPNADFIGQTDLLNLAKETSGMLYHFKIPFRDLGSAEFILGQGKIYGLDLQKPVYLFGNTNGDIGAMISLSDSSKTRQAIDKIRKKAVLSDSSSKNHVIYYLPEIKLYLHFGKQYLLLYKGDSFRKIQKRVSEAKFLNVSPLWKSYLSKKTFKKEHLVIYSEWSEIKKAGLDYVMLAHDSDSLNLEMKYYLRKNKGFNFKPNTNGLGFAEAEQADRSINIHMDVSKFKNSTNDPLKSLLIKLGKKISFPTQAFFDSWGGDLSFFEGGKQMAKERIIVSELDEDFNVTEVVKYQDIIVPGYSVSFNTNDKGEIFFNQLFKKGLLRKDEGGYRFLFSPLLKMEKKDGYYQFYSGQHAPKMITSLDNKLNWKFKGTSYLFHLDSINRKEIFGTVRFPALKLYKKLKIKSSS